VLLTAALVSLAAWQPRVDCSGDYCGALVIAAAGELETLLPPVAVSSTARDVSDQLFRKLADVGMSSNTIGDEDFQPDLAQRWEWRGPLTLVFHLDPAARWQDGRPVTAADVAFTFDAYTDSLVASSSRASLRFITAVAARDSLTAVFRFQKRYPEMFYDAVYHMRILPAHLLRDVPRDQWTTAPFGRAPIGDGPYRFLRWKAGETLELVADSTYAPAAKRAHIRRVIWRFTPNLPVSVLQVVAGDADAVEVLGPPDFVRQAQAAPQLATYPYKGQAYGYLGFNFAAPGDSSHPHALFSDRRLRRALVMAIDREPLRRNVFGDLAKLPPGPMSQLSWIWDPEIRGVTYDSAGAARLLRALGWIDTNGDGIRDRGGLPLSFRILVPTSSAIRRQYARLLQEKYRVIGVDVQLDEVDFGLFLARARAGQFDALLNSWNTDPTPSAGIPQTWTARGVGSSNYGRYVNPAFDQLVDRTVASASTRASARRSWRRAMEMLNQDAPAIFLFAPDNVAAVDKRVAGVVIRPDSWLALLRTWHIPADKLTERDRVDP
jgi:peptide/nickel transport system substrate-binding protein